MASAQAASVADILATQGVCAEAESGMRHEVDAFHNQIFGHEAAASEQSAIGGISSALDTAVSQPSVRISPIGEESSRAVTDVTKDSRVTQPDLEPGPTLRLIKFNLKELKLNFKRAFD